MSARRRQGATPALGDELVHHAGRRLNVGLDDVDVRTVESASIESKLLSFELDFDDICGLELLRSDESGQRVDELVFYGSTQRPGADIRSRLL